MRPVPGTGLFAHPEGQGLLAIPGGVILLHDGGLGEGVLLFAQNNSLRPLTAGEPDGMLGLESRN